MTVRWVGTVDLGSGWLRYRGPVSTAEMHAHHAIQVIVASQPVSLSTPDGRSVTTALAVVPADAPHRIDASGQTATLYYLEPPAGPPWPTAGPTDWAAAGRTLGHPGAPSPLAECQELRRRLPWGAGQRTPGLDQDDLIRQAQDEIRNRLPERVRLADIAAAVAMSPTRLTHRFSAAAGIPFGRWVLWERLQRAGIAVADGADLTAAAHQAGFADSAHLNRTFRKMFGIAPSEVAGAVSWRVHP